MWYFKGTDPKDLVRAPEEAYTRTQGFGPSEKTAVATPRLMPAPVRAPEDPPKASKQQEKPYKPVGVSKVQAQAPPDKERRRSKARNSSRGGRRGR